MERTPEMKNGLIAGGVAVASSDTSGSFGYIQYYATRVQLSK